MLNKLAYGRLLVVFAIVALFALLIYVGFSAYAGLQQSIMEREEQNAAFLTFVQARELETSFLETSDDLLALAGLSNVQALADAISRGDQQSISALKQDIQNTFFSVVQAKRAYLQLRLLSFDEQGLELVRVDRDANGLPRIVREDQLQEKGHRDYVQQSLALSPGRHFISQVSLNQENGVIEEPHTPVARYLTPVAAADGTPVLLLAINLDLTADLDALAHSSDGFGTFVVDQDGHYLVHPDSSRSFEFEFGETQSAFVDFDGFERLDALAVDGSGQTFPGVRYLGEPITLAAARVVYAPGQSLTILQARADETVLASVQEELRPAAILVLVSIVMIMLMLFLLYRAGMSRAQAQTRAEADFHAALDASPAAMLLLEHGGKVIHVNQAAQRMFGYSNDEFLDLQLEHLVPQRFREQHPAMRQAYENAPTVRRMGVGRELFALRNGGEEFPVEVGLSPFEANQGPRVIAFVLDITERRQSAIERERFLEELERSNAELQQFAYVASHDLQEPLRMVTSFCGLLKDRYADKLDAKGVEFINFAVDGATRMRSQIDDLLDYSRLQYSQRHEMEVSTRVALDEALKNLEASIKDSGAQFTIGDLPNVMGDENQLTRLFQNLVGNSLKFRGDARPHVKISARRVDDFFQFSVSDNGIGIDAAHADLVFKIFQRVHNRQIYPGTGVGLSICKRIVEQHGGKIWIEKADTTPETPAGARFHFTLRVPE